MKLEVEGWIEFGTWTGTECEVGDVVWFVVEIEYGIKSRTGVQMAVWVGAEMEVKLEL